MENKIIINKKCTVTKGGILLDKGLVQGTKYRFFTCFTNKKYITIQAVQNDYIVFSYDFFVGSKQKANKLQLECMKMFNLNFETI